VPALGRALACRRQAARVSKRLWGQTSARPALPPGPTRSRAREQAAWAEAFSLPPGPIPIEEAFPLARQIPEALEYAHEHGIVPRD